MARGVLLAVFVAVNVVVLIALFAAVLRRLLAVRFGRVRLLPALRGIVFGNGAWQDNVIYSLLRDEASGCPLSR